MNTHMFHSAYARPDVSFRKTKIVCTIGPACWEVPQLETLMETGMNVARLNFSHGDHAGHGATLERVRQAAKNKSRNVAIMLDTKGPEIRSGFFANDAKKITLEKGETIILTTVRLCNSMTLGHYIRKCSDGVLNDCGSRLSSLSSDRITPSKVTLKNWHARMRLSLVP